MSRSRFRSAIAPARVPLALLLTGAALSAGCGSGLGDLVDGAAPDTTAPTDPAVTATEATAAVPAPPGGEGDYPLVDLRAALDTTVFLGDTDRTPAPQPPAGELELVTYPAPLGDNVAYVSPAPDGEPRPAIIWIAGGFDWGIGSWTWEPGAPDNDQSGTVFRERGIVTMYPALRGSNENPGTNECMLGEVDDVLAAAEWLRTRPGVDPERIYLGGHSTGGTLTLLAAESTGVFRAVFSFGPVANPASYETCPLADPADAESQARSPYLHLETITSPTWMIEGSINGNIQALDFMVGHIGTAPVQAVEVPGADHFTVLHPGSLVVADAILADTGPEPTLAVTAEAIVAGLG